MPPRPENVPAWLPLTTFLAKGPRYLATYALWRGRRAAARRFAGRPRWPDALRSSIASAAGDAPRAYLLARARPAPLVTPTSVERVIAVVPAAERERTCRAADDIVERRFRYRGREVTFAGGRIDWRTCPGGNTDWTWDLNRHHFAVELGRAHRYRGDERYASSFRDLFRDWFEQNPPGVEAPAWRSVFEVGVRAVNWCWAHALFLDAPVLDDAFHRELLRAILGTGRFLARHLERHAWNNHLLLEAKALAMLGLLYPELPGARAWARGGLRVLERELRRQVGSDGVHSERSTFYHKLIASELLEMAVVLRLAARVEHDVTAALEALCVFLQAITRDDGSIPLFGDASRHDAHVRFDALEGAAVLLENPELRAPRRGRQEDYAGALGEGTAWLLAALGKDLPATPPRGAISSVAFPAGGFWILRAGAGGDAGPGADGGAHGDTHGDTHGATVHLIFDCGPFGDAVVAGHGHADALSVDLAIGGQHALVDPGMYSAHLGESWRNHFRGTAAHNTVRVDERDQSLLRGTRRVYRPARATCTHWRSTPLHDHVRGEHDGYRRLPGPIRHEREILFLKPDLFLVIDRLDGEGEHLFESYFHFPPAAALEERGDALELRGADGRGVLVAPLDAPEGGELDLCVGRASPPGGWVAYLSGVKEPAPTACYRLRARAPLVRATLIAPLLAEAQSTALARLAVERGGAEGAPAPPSSAAALGFVRGCEDIIAFARFERDAGRDRLRIGGGDGVGDVVTDARLLLLVRTPDFSPRRAILVGATRLDLSGEPVFAAADTPGDYAFDGEAWTRDDVPLDERASLRSRAAGSE